MQIVGESISISARTKLKVTILTQGCQAPSVSRCYLELYSDVIYLSQQFRWKDHISLYNQWQKWRDIFTNLRSGNLEHKAWAITAQFLSFIFHLIVLSILHAPNKCQ